VEILAAIGTAKSAQEVWTTLHPYSWHHVKEGNCAHCERWKQ
jgi:hypothetical protein